jgi:hypothetical protein
MKNSNLLIIFIKCNLFLFLGILACLFFRDFIENGLDVFRNGLDPRFFNIKFISFIFISMVVIFIFLFTLELLNFREKTLKKIKKH